jgi:acyl carrier protein
MTTLETIAARHLARLVEPPLEDAARVDLDADVFDMYGLTSLKMMLLITSICDDAGADLSRFTDDDVAALKTLRGIVRHVDPVERVER